MRGDPRTDVDRQTSRFMTAFEEVTEAALQRPGGANREDRGRAVWRAVEDGVLQKTDAEMYEELKTVRNSIAHVRHGGQPVARATPAAVNAIEAIRTKLVGTEPTVWSFCGEVTSIAPDATVAEACRIMRHDDYTCLPVVTDAGLHGLLSATDVVWWVGGALDELGLIEDVPVSEVMNAHTTIDYVLVERRFPQRDVPPVFAGTGRSGCPVGAVLVTVTGQPHEPLSGIITPWDLAEIGDGR